jgi:predicted nuclease with TOPRIM domain
MEQKLNKKVEEMEQRLNEQQEEIKKNKKEFQQILEKKDKNFQAIMENLDNEIKEKDIKIESLKDLTFDMIKAELNIDRLSKGFPIACPKNSHNELISFLRKQESEIISLYSYLKFRGILDGYQELKKMK